MRSGWRPRGLPGVALPLAHELASLPEDVDPVVHLALRATSTARFLDVDANLVRLLEVWVLDAGGEHARLRDSRGLHYLRALLTAPGKDIRALDLVAGGAGLPGSGVGPALDATARDAYRARVADLTERLDAADRAGDRLAAERAEAERQALLTELRRAAGLGGRDRVVAPEAERARVNVTRTLRATIERVAAAAPRAASHLRASIRTGGACRYDPAPGGPSRWQL